KNYCLTTPCSYPFPGRRFLSFIYPQICIGVLVEKLESSSPLQCNDAKRKQLRMAERFRQTNSRP
ncbi:hypothetical protein EVAR_71950_1, partial [Eumeta japonica]